MMRKLVLALLLALLLTNVARADSPPEMSDYSVTTPDGKGIFVMLSPSGNEQPEIRALYSQSGLYSASDPTQMLYGVDWYSWNIALSNNGDYVVRWGDWARHRQYDALALEFYDRGQLLKSYRISDLTQRFDQLFNTSLHIEWQFQKELDLETNQLNLELVTEQNYTFDITTGEVVAYTEGTENELLKQMIEMHQLEQSRIQTAQSSIQPVPQPNQSFDFLPISIFLLFIIMCLAIVWWVYKLRSDA